MTGTTDNNLKAAGRQDGIVSLPMRFPCGMTFVEWLIHGAAERAGDSGTMRALEMIGIARLFGLPARLVIGDGNYSSARLEAARFEMMIRS